MSGISSSLMSYFSWKLEILEINEVLAIYWVFQASKGNDFDSLDSWNFDVDEYAPHL